jgi:A/G-specific adenine glycosylase
VCTRRQPVCERCPISDHCAWHRAGRPDPDPVTGSAGIATPQSTFAGSDRQGRGRLVDALRRGPVAAAHAADVAGWPADRRRAQRIVEQLVADGLARVDGDELSLP